MKVSAAARLVRSVIRFGDDRRAWLRSLGMQKRIEEFVARSVKQVDDKIASARLQATAEVRAAAADAAVKISEQILSKGAPGGADFVAAGIQNLRALVH